MLSFSLSLSLSNEEEETKEREKREEKKSWCLGFVGFKEKKRKKSFWTKKKVPHKFLRERRHTLLLLMASSSASRQTAIFLKKTARFGLRNVGESSCTSSKKSGNAAAKEGQQHLHLLRYRLIDAKGEVLGRLASRVSLILQGKDKPTFDRSKASGDACVVVNASKIHLSGRKMEQKKFHRHTGFVGGLVTRTAREMHERDETFLIRKAVERMLPKNQLRREHMRKLRVFPDEEHPFQHLGDRLVPFEMPPRALKRSEGEDAYRLESERNDEGGDDDDAAWQSFNPEMKEEMNKRYKKSVEAKRGWRMGQKGRQYVDLD